MEPSRELREDRMLGVGGDTLDHQLMVGDAEGQRGAIAKQVARAASHRGGGGRERGMALGVHGVLVQGNGQLDEEFTELA